MTYHDDGCCVRHFHRASSPPFEPKGYGLAVEVVIRRWALSLSLFAIFLSISSAPSSSLLPFSPVVNFCRWWGTHAHPRNRCSFRSCESQRLGTSCNVETSHASLNSNVSNCQRGRRLCGQHILFQAVIDNLSGIITFATGLELMWNLCQGSPHSTTPVLRLRDVPQIADNSVIALSEDCELEAGYSIFTYVEKTAASDLLTPSQVLFHLGKVKAGTSLEITADDARMLPPARPISITVMSVTFAPDAFLVLKGNFSEGTNITIFDNAFQTETSSVKNVVAVQSAIYAFAIAIVPFDESGWSASQVRLVIVRNSHKISRNILQTTQTCAVLMTNAHVVGSISSEVGAVRLINGSSLVFESNTVEVPSSTYAQSAASVVCLALQNSKPLVLSSSGVFGPSSLSVTGNGLIFSAPTVATSTSRLVLFDMIGAGTAVRLEADCSFVCRENALAVTSFGVGSAVHVISAAFYELDVAHGASFVISQNIAELTDARFLLSASASLTSAVVLAQTWKIHLREGSVFNVSHNRLYAERIGIATIAFAVLRLMAVSLELPSAELNLLSSLNAGGATRFVVNSNALIASDIEADVPVSAFTAASVELENLNVGGYAKISCSNNFVTASRLADKSALVVHALMLKPAISLSLSAYAVVALDNNRIRLADNSVVGALCVSLLHIGEAFSADLSTKLSTSGNTLVVNQSALTSASYTSYAACIFCVQCVSTNVFMLRNTVTMLNSNTSYSMIVGLYQSGMAFDTVGATFVFQNNSFTTANSSHSTNSEAGFLVGVVSLQSLKGLRFSRRSSSPFTPTTVEFSENRATVSNAVVGDVVVAGLQVADGVFVAQHAGTTVNFTGGSAFVSGNSKVTGSIAVSRVMCSECVIEKGASVLMTDSVAQLDGLRVPANIVHVARIFARVSMNVTGAGSAVSLARNRAEVFNFQSSGVSIHVAHCTVDGPVGLDVGDNAVLSLSGNMIDVEDVDIVHVVVAHILAKVNLLNASRVEVSNNSIDCWHGCFGHMAAVAVVQGAGFDLSVKHMSRLVMDGNAFSTRGRRRHSSPTDEQFLVDDRNPASAFSTLSQGITAGWSFILVVTIQMLSFSVFNRSHVSVCRNQFRTIVGDSLWANAHREDVGEITSVVRLVFLDNGADETGEVVLQELSECIFDDNTMHVFVASSALADEGFIPAHTLVCAPFALLFNVTLRSKSTLSVRRNSFRAPLRSFQCRGHFSLGCIGASASPNNFRMRLEESCQFNVQHNNFTSFVTFAANTLTKNPTDCPIPLVFLGEVVGAAMPLLDDDYDSRPSIHIFENTVSQHVFITRKGVMFFNGLFGSAEMSSSEWSPTTAFVAMPCAWLSLGEVSLSGSTALVASLNTVIFDTSQAWVDFSAALSLAGRSSVTIAGNNVWHSVAGNAPSEFSAVGVSSLTVSDAAQINVVDNTYDFCSMRPTVNSSALREQINWRDRMLPPLHFVFQAQAQEGAGRLILCRNVLYGNARVTPERIAAPSSNLAAFRSIYLCPAQTKTPSSSRETKTTTQTHNLSMSSSRSLTVGSNSKSAVVVTASASRSASRSAHVIISTTLTDHRTPTTTVVRTESVNFRTASVNFLAPIPRIGPAEQTSKDVAEAVGTFVAITSVFSVSGGRLGTLNAMSRLGTCEGPGSDDEEEGGGDVPILVHPLRFSVGPGSEGMYAAASISNALIIPLALGLAARFPVASLVRKATDSTMEEALTTVGWPFVVAMPYVTLAEGIGVSVVRSLISGTAAGVSFGLVGLLCTLMLCAAWARALIAVIPRTSVCVAPNKDLSRFALLRAIDPVRVWVPREGGGEASNIKAHVTPAQLEAYGNALGGKWFYYVEVISFACSLLVGVMEGVPPSSRAVCVGRAAVAMIATCVQCVLSCMTFVPFELVLQAGATLCVVPMAVLALVQVAADEAGSFEDAIACLTVAANAFGFALLGVALIVGLRELVSPAVAHRTRERKMRMEELGARDRSHLHVSPSPPTLDNRLAPLLVSPTHVMSEEEEMVPAAASLNPQRLSNVVRRKKLTHPEVLTCTREIARWKFSHA